MTSFDFDVIGESPRKDLPNVQKPPAVEKPSVVAEKPLEKVAAPARDKAA